MPNLRTDDNLKGLVTRKDRNLTLKINNRNTKKRCEICSNLTIKTPERRKYCLGCYLPNRRV